MAIGGDLVFFTIHEEKSDNGRRNPRSALLVEALRQHILEVEALQKRGCVAVVLDSPNVVPATVAVALFDVNFGVNRWSPRPNNASRTPSWARALSSGWCVAVGYRCVALPSHVKDAARQIAAMFSQGRCEKGVYPWGSAPSRVRSHRGRDNIRPRPESRSHLAL